MSYRLALIFGLALIASGCASTSNPDQQADMPEEQMEEPGQEMNEPEQTINSSQESSQTSNNTVTLTSTGFEPSTITIDQGETVKWVNEGSRPMWIGSDRHPTHTNYEGRTVSEHCENGEPVSSSVFDQCSRGESFSFTFEKTGEWGYHNHLASAQTGTVVVE